MQLRTRTWLVICVLSLVGAAVFWRLGEQRLAGRAGTTSVPTVQPAAVPSAATPLLSPSSPSATTSPAQPTASSAPPSPAASLIAPSATNRASLRLRNTTRSIDELARDDRAVLLRNALIDTTSGTALPIPDHLRAGAEAGSYVVQARGIVSEKFREAITSAGASVVSYLPNNAFLVAATAAQSERLARSAGVGAVFAFEPYFKLEPALLPKAVQQEPVGAGARLNLTLLPGSRDRGVARLEEMGAAVVGEFPTPFGPAVTVDPAQASLVALAQLPEVQGIELFRQRQMLSDLTRPRLGISFGTNAPGAFTNTLGLTGTNVFVGVNDSGIDATHPDLEGRVTADLPRNLTDPFGHGTHVAGIIAGSGLRSTSVSNVPPGSVRGADFRGMAPSAKLYSQFTDPDIGPATGDAYLVGNFATNYFITLGGTNIPIVNNSWGYPNSAEYTTASATFDAAVRDSLPEMAGEQAVVYVFAAGNDGKGASSGQAGEPSTVASPATGKNVIAVGAIESPRGITNEVVGLDELGNLSTNRVFEAETDTSFQVIGQSSRGNVEPGIEGVYGRFKPDVVAPGSFILSTRSAGWTDPTEHSSPQTDTLTNQEIGPGAQSSYTLLVPNNATRFSIRIIPNERSPRPFPALPLFLKFNASVGAADQAGSSNVIQVPPDAVLQPGIWVYAVANPTARPISFDIQTSTVLAAQSESYFTELKKINDAVGPDYVFATGTSMAAPAVTGMLALFQDWLQREKRSSSPALLKALLINGSRSLGSMYNFSVRDVINLQGWGLVNLSNTLPAGEIGSPTGGVFGIQYTHQTGSNALVTGQSRSWDVKVSPTAQDQILKLTLVWTDPPGNPNAGVKLVNDLDLEVRNVATGELIAGNDMPYRSDFNTVHTDASTMTNDVVNNVENILIRPPLGTNYTVTVRGSRVHVNAVTSHPDGIAQDFALVASLENTALTNALTIASTPVDLAINVPLLRFPTNGLGLFNQRVGANSPKFGAGSGATNQWLFYVFTNLTQFTPDSIGITNGQYVAFLTSPQQNLSAPRAGDPDIDLYVSTDPSLTNLSPVAIAAARKSRNPGGSELVFYTNSVLGTVYYVGVKSEDQQAAEFSFVSLSSNIPFDQDDEDGNRIVNGLPFRVPIPDGSPDQPSAGYVYGIVTKELNVQTVTVTNTVSYDSTGDILWNLSHAGEFSVLNNHALNPEGSGGLFTLLFDDSNGNDSGFGTLFPRRTDGPGHLTSFTGQPAAGVWILTVVDNAISQTSTNVAMTLKIVPQPPDNGFIFGSLEPFASVVYTKDVPVGATNFTVRVASINPARPLEVSVQRGEAAAPGGGDKHATIPPSGGDLSIGLRDVPPLNPGRYFITVYNPNEIRVEYAIRFSFGFDPSASNESTYGLDLPLPVRDDARFVSRLLIGEDLEIADIKVGIRAQHPRISDLVFRLVSPFGDRLLLAENRGGPSGKAYGGLRFGQKIFTTFPSDTNLANIAIKDGIAPFTNNPAISGSSNRVIMADSFERAAAGVYAAGSVVLPGWQVTEGNVAVVQVAPGVTNVADGSKYISFVGGSSGIGTNVVLSPDQLYRVRFAAGRVGIGGNQGLRLYIGGVLGLELKNDTLGAGWYRQTYLFKAPAARTLIEFRTPASGAAYAVDDVSIEEADPPLNAYFQPEETLRSLVGKRSIGDWKLEVTDSRAGPLSSELSDFEWRLEMIYARPAVEAVRLTNNVPYFGVIDGTEIKYFYVEVPFCATLSSNVVSGELGSLMLFGDRAGLPQASQSEFLDDYGPYLNVEAGGIGQFTLTTNFPAAAPLIPGQRYYLAVRNYQFDRTNNSFGIRVQFDCEDPGLPVVPSLTNSVATVGQILPGPQLHYYQFVVSTNAVQTDFELTGINGNVDMYVRYARLDDFPLPSPNVFDYLADNPDPAVVDRISVERVSLPMPLVPGVWYVAIRNSDTRAVDYTIKATESYTTIVNLTNAVAYPNLIGPTDPLVGIRSTNLQYYAFFVSPNAIGARFETFGADGDINLYVRRGLPIPTPSDFHFASRSPGNLDEVISVVNTDSPVWLSPGWWFLTVENSDAANVAYSIRATEFPANIIPLADDIPFTNVVAAGAAPDYYSFQVSPSALAAKFEVYGMSDDVHLLLRRDLPVPNNNDFTYASRNPGLVEEVIELTPFSFPVNLTPGPWYLGVVNNSGNNATYTVRASEQTARIVTLTNGIPQNASLRAGGELDYFQFTVSPGATAAEFKLTSAGAGDLDLFVRKGPPLPDASNFHYAGQGSGTGDEVIRLGTNSAPVPVSPGIWYLSVTNKEAATVGYEITATEFGVVVPPPSDQITNIVVTTNSVCLTWISIPGTNYYVVARSNVLSAAWTPVSPTLTATDTTTTWCLQPPGPWRVFDVLVGESPLVPIVDPVPVLRLSGTDICVSWASVPGTNYFVEAKKSFTEVNWTVLTPVITAQGATTEVCYPIVLGYRFFRVGVGDRGVPVPTPVPSDKVDVIPGPDGVCVTFPSKPGLDYIVQAKRDTLEANWTVVSEALRGTGLPVTFCLSGLTDFRYFQVIEGVTIPLAPPASVPVPAVRLAVDGAFQLCLTWDTLLGGEYFVEAKERIADPSWSVISPISKASSTTLSFCQSLASKWRYFQVRRVNSVVEPIPHIDAIEMTARGPRIVWSGSAGARYQMFYSDAPMGAWLPLGGPVTSVTGTLEFIDDGTMVPFSGPFRLYRIQRLP